jgi:flagellar FliL protein
LATEAATATAPKPKGKKMLVIIVAVVLLLVAAGGGWFVFGRKAASEDGEEAPVEHVADKHKTPPVYLPMENMVVNLADPGGEKFAQIGITIETTDQKTSDAVKAYLPNIRSGVLMLISQRTSEELLSKDGKTKLSLDVLREVSRPLGYTVEEPEDEHEAKPKKKGEDAPRKRRAEPNPVTGILFSSFIIQ